MLSKNKYIIVVFLYLLGYVIYDIAPKYYWENYVFLRVFYYICQYGLIFTLGLFLFQETYDSISKAALFVLMCFSVTMFIFHVLLINRDLPTYIEICNSEKAALVIDGGIILASILFWFYLVKKMIK